MVLRPSLFYIPIWEDPPPTLLSFIKLKIFNPTPLIVARFMSATETYSKVYK